MFPLSARTFSSLKKKSSASRASYIRFFFLKILYSLDFAAGRLIFNESSIMVAAHFRRCNFFQIVKAGLELITDAGLFSMKCVFVYPTCWTVPMKRSLASTSSRPSCNPSRRPERYILSRWLVWTVSQGLISIRFSRARSRRALSASIWSSHVRL